LSDLEAMVDINNFLLDREIYQAFGELCAQDAEDVIV
jgi:hypothetical protein